MPVICDLPVLGMKDHNSLVQVPACAKTMERSPFPAIQPPVICDYLVGFKTVGSHKSQECLPASNSFPSGALLRGVPRNSTAV